MLFAGFASVSLLWLITGISFSDLSAGDLSKLDKGRNVRIVMIGQGPLCDAKVEVPSPSVVTLRLSKNTVECGNKGDLLRVRAEDTVDVVGERRLTQDRVVAKLLLGVADVGLLSLYPLKSSDPESVMILGNAIIPAGIIYGAWKIVPKRLGYLSIINCTDRLHCVSKVMTH